MKKILIIIVIFTIFLSSCNSVRESAGVNRKVIDEYAVIENPPLVIPPNFNLLPPEQIKSKEIENTDSELAKEILFGLDDSEFNSNNNVLIDEILDMSGANNTDDNIRETINEEFAGEKSSIKDETQFNSNEELNKAIDKTSNELDETQVKEKKKKKIFLFLVSYADKIL